MKAEAGDERNHELLKGRFLPVIERFIKIGRTERWDLIDSPEYKRYLIDDGIYQAESRLNFIAESLVVEDHAAWIKAMAKAGTLLGLGGGPESAVMHLFSCYNRRVGADTEGMAKWFRQSASEWSECLPAGEPAEKDINGAGVPFETYYADWRRSKGKLTFAEKSDLEQSVLF